MRPLILGAALLLTSAVLADSGLPPAPLSDTQLADPRQEAAAQTLMETIRCLVCQGQSIADSNAELAGDMRALIRQRIAAGEKPAAVRAWLVRRYGAWVSYEPPLDRVTWLLWAAPALFLVAGLFLARRSFRPRQRR
ncbi:cytochrome c-type biogenesis protein [Sphingomonas crusticola]|uniref:cytochrome c-type biogenesis protein n=1 Tax=Sphingomonas crusticola TaxID=1697973 RepID=UPI000E273832|nr:cytochrome c-type biogenesis protein [Sphingomonas crusticola]